MHERKTEGRKDWKKKKEGEKGKNNKKKMRRQCRL